MADAAHDKIIQRNAHAGNGGRPVTGPTTQLGDHRVVIDGYGVAFGNAGVIAGQAAIIMMRFCRRAI